MEGHENYDPVGHVLISREYPRHKNVCIFVSGLNKSVSRSWGGKYPRHEECDHMDKFGDFRTNGYGIRDIGPGLLYSVINRDVPVIQKSPNLFQMCLDIIGSE